MLLSTSEILKIQEFYYPIYLLSRIEWTRPKKDAQRLPYEFPSIYD